MSQLEPLGQPRGDPHARAEASDQGWLGPRVRPARPEDAARVAELYLETVRVSMPWLRLAHTPDEVRDWVPRGLLGSHEVWLAVEEERLLGFLALSPDYTWVDHLYIGPDQQARGLGGELLSLAQARSRGGLRLWAFVRNQRARTFYEQRGFRVLYETDGSGNEEREPDLLYEWLRSGSS